MKDISRTTVDRPRPRVALAHDWLVGLRGGEFVLDAIVRSLEGSADIAALYVMFDDRRSLTPAVDTIPKVVSRLGRAPLATRLRRWLLPAYPRAVSGLSRRLALDHARSPVDLLISTSSAAIKGLAPPAGVPHLCYCHTPARYLWSQTREYAEQSSLSGLGLRMFGDHLRAWDKDSARHVTRFVANSSHTASEIRRCYGRDASVIFPPVRTSFFTPPPPGHARGTHWLVVSALEPYKRIDLAIEAANQAGHELRIVGGGSHAVKLRARAGPAVRFLGRVSDEQLRAEYRDAALLIFPQIEDFGIVAAEAQACGLPVVARRAGGALDSVIDGVTGVLFDTPTSESILSAIARVPHECGPRCVENAARFAESVFEEQFCRTIREMLNAKPPTLPASAPRR